MTDRIDDKIDEMFLLREQKRELEASIKEVNAKIMACNDWLLEKYQDVGTTTGRGSMASATLTETVVPTIEDWDKVCEYIRDNDALYLVHRRVSVGPWKELRDAGENIPGITPYTKRAISLRKLGD